MIVSNLDHVPGKRTGPTIGIVFGYAKGSDENIKEVFEKARKELVKHGGELSCDAILKVDGKITRDPDGKPEIMLVGTGVKLSEEGAGKVSVSIEGEEPDWSIGPTNPSTEVVRMMKERNREDKKTNKLKKDIYDLADEIGISYDKAKLLMEKGFDDLESISGSSPREMSDIDGINPTQARILIKKARELLDTERGL
jgi:hypothetical protein